MARMKRESVIDELTEKGIQFDPQAKYADLWKLLKEQTHCPHCGADEVSELTEGYWPYACGCSSLAAHLPRFPVQLVDRAKKIGFSDEQIATYTDPEKLEMACDRLKPQVKPLPPPKNKRQVFRPFKEQPKGEPAQAVFTSQISALRAANLIRAGYDDSNLGVFCRQHKIRAESIQKVTVVRNYVPDKRDILTSTFIIDYLKKG